MIRKPVSLILIFSFLLLTGCGSQREVEPKVPVPPPPKPKPDPVEEVSFADVQAITTVACLRCHSTSQFLKAEAAWKSSLAKARVSANEMPPATTPEARNLSAEDRATLVNFQ